MFSALEWIMKGAAVWLVLLLFVYAGYRGERGVMGGFGAQQLPLPPHVPDGIVCDLHYLVLWSRSAYEYPDIAITDSCGVAGAHTFSCSSHITPTPTALLTPAQHIYFSWITTKSGSTPQSYAQNQNHKVYIAWIQ